MAEPATKKPKLNGSESKSATEIQNFIDGKFRPASSGQFLDVIAPADGSVIGKVGLSNAADVDAAVAAARRAFESWSAQTVKRRVQCLFKFHQLLVEHKDELAALINKEHGKNMTEALGEVAKGNETVEWACSMPQLIGGNFLEVSRGVTCRDVRRPQGVVVSVVPFNFPAMVPLWTLPIAIAAGNCIIVKPSEKVPLTMARMCELLAEAGVPPGVVSCVNGTKVAVEALIDHPGVDAVTFVGSTPIAELVSKRARAINKRVLALGGAKNHLVCLPDCNVDLASTDILNSFAGCSGQRCMAASALLVVGEQKELLEAIVEKAKARKPGKGPRDLGPVIDQQSLDKIHRYIAQAEAQGAKILIDGRSWTKSNPNGFWVGPTVILHNSADEPAMKDEIFGPVLSVLRVDSKEEAVRIENSNPYGNAAAIYTSVGEHADWFAARFSAGMIGINIGVPVPREPFSFGGINRSKFGDFDITGDGGMEFFTKRIKITQKWTAPPPHLATWMD